MRSSKETFHVRNLKRWSMPWMEEIHGRLMEELRKKTFTIRIDEECLGEEIYEAVSQRARELIEAGVNDVMLGFARGEANGSQPEDCFAITLDAEKQGEKALMLTYTVENSDDSRVEINRADLREVLSRALGEDEDAAAAQHRMQVAAALREMAANLEQG